MKVVILLSPLLIAAQSLPQQRAAGDVRIDWAADLRSMVDQLKLNHPDPFHDISEEEFDANTAALADRIGGYSDWRAAIELQRLLASLGEGHTALKYVQPDFGVRGFPIRFQSFSDGIFVQAIPNEHAALAGSRLVRVGETPVEKAKEALFGISSADNMTARERQVPFLLSLNIPLHGLGIIPDPDSATYLLRRSDGELQALTLSALPVEKVRTLLDPAADVPPDPAWKRMRDGAGTPDPLWLKREGVLYWHEYLSQADTVYAQVNRLYDRDEFNFERFTKEVFGTFDRQGADKLVIDLRHNSGGDHIDLPFIHEIISRPKLRERGSLFVLIGGATFSAAQTFVNHLDKHTEAIFVGEPTGQRPNMYGVSRRFTLPSSGLPVGHSRYYIQGSDPADYRSATIPDIAVPYTSGDYASNRDPALETALAYKGVPLPNIVAAMTEAYEAGGMAKAREVYRRIQPLYRAEGVSSEREVNQLGYDRLREKQVEEAIGIFRLNVEQYPASPNVYDSLGEGLIAAGKRAEALAVLTRGLAINPSNADIRRRLRILKRQ